MYNVYLNKTSQRYYKWKIDLYNKVKFAIALYKP